ncbi:MAG: potassium transporter Kup [Bacteroidetes bacterium RIFCSPLOWO2_02_FULL_36_8]|nr:MAG: potassium transporter Kup [Bacteroidetes bacterium RIFCSPLOWO2_02_FULL_36_8]OFY68820.1 MAG: potassium transporter Kup [Bacteroidetes bacterium RIFCSPLOWO2_12_FULL_37_12]
MQNDIHKKITGAGVLITLGIIFGDIGTSPLYVLKAIMGEREISELLVYGGLSCVFWTLTIQTTFKYISLTLQADNHGEGGIFSLYALVKKHHKWLYFPAFVGAGTMLADGIITPPISVTSAIEGLKIISPDIPVIPIVIFILIILFAFQQFGTKIVGAAFGPIMLLWFSMLFVLGIRQVFFVPEILKAINPVYAYELLKNYPAGFWLLGSVFLATTGAEALYSDLGHCGRKNIRISWMFVKAALIANYFGQGAWMLSSGKTHLLGANPFYEIMPLWFLWIGIGIATVATFIASQALITGSFTLISEAVSLNFWPRVLIKYPTNIKGQLYIPSINWFLFAGCVGAVLFFQESARMEAAYGFNISIAMMMTTFLMTYYLLYVKKFPTWIVVVILIVFVSVESCFFVANLLKIKQAWAFLLIVFAIIFTMYVWYRGRKILNKLVVFLNINEHLPTLVDLSHDNTISKYASNLIYLTSANNPRQIERRIIYSIINRNPKRADIYWFIHVDRTNEPYTMEYSVDPMFDKKVFRINFRLGFRIQPRVNLLFRKVIEEMVAKKELDISSPYKSLSKYKLPSDFKFVILERFLSIENEFSLKEGFILNSYFLLRRIGLPDTKTFGLDTSDVTIEKIPLIISPVTTMPLKRME